MQTQLVNGPQNSLSRCQGSRSSIVKGVGFGDWLLGDGTLGPDSRRVWPLISAIRWRTLLNSGSLNDLRGRSLGNSHLGLVGRNGLLVLLGAGKRESLGKITAENSKYRIRSICQN